MIESVFRKDWKFQLIGGPVAFLIFGIIALITGFFGFIGAAGILASIGGLIGAAMLFEGVKNLLSSARLTVTDEQIILKAGGNNEYMLTKEKCSENSWDAENMVLGVAFDDGTALSLKDFNCEAIYNCLEEHDWPYLPEFPAFGNKQASK
jgi:hypothetical protein